MPGEIAERCDTIEDCYEFMLAYAGRGVPGDKARESGQQIRDCLQRAADALRGLAEHYAGVIRQRGLQPAEKYRAFLAVLERDTKDSLAAIDLVLAQPAISSQLIDNLNASIHLRSLLTDLFLISEIVGE